MMNSSMEIIVKTLFLIISISVVPLFSSSIYCEEWSDAQKEVWEMQKAVYSLWKKGEVEGVLALYHDNCTIWYHRGTFTSGKDFIKQRLNYDPNLESFDLEPQDIKVFGNTAIIHYSVKWAIHGAEYNERNTATWMKNNGKWLIIGRMIAQQ